MIDLAEYVDKPELLEIESYIPGTHNQVVLITEVAAMADEDRWVVVFNNGNYSRFLPRKTDAVRLRKPKTIKQTFYRASYIVGVGFSNSEVTGRSVMKTDWYSSKEIVKKMADYWLFNWEEKEFEIPKENGERDD